MLIVDDSVSILCYKISFLVKIEAFFNYILNQFIFKKKIQSFHQKLSFNSTTIIHFFHKFFELNFVTHMFPVMVSYV